MNRVDATIQSDRRPHGAARGGYSLVEIVVVVGILSILLAVTIMSTRAISASRAKSSADAQIALIASAIEKYASFWPRLEINGQVVADRGWPDPFAARVFNTTIFNADAPFNTRVDFEIDGAGSGLFEDLINFSAADRVVSDDGTGGDILAANVCLTHALLSPTGQGPYLQDDDARALIKRVVDVDGGTAHTLLPSLQTQNSSKTAEVLVDPWGTPYRYFWVYRSATAFRGYLPVETALVGAPNFRKAVGYVLESAGPDRKFGNVWVDGVPLTRNVDEAADNITVTP